MFVKPAPSYEFHNPDGLYFITFATASWVDVFTRLHHRTSIQLG